MNTETKAEEREERDKSLASFIEEWEKIYGHVPVWRRTKRGQFMFDEGLPTQFMVDSCLLGRYSRLMVSSGQQALQARFFKH